MQPRRKNVLKGCFGVLGTLLSAHGVLVGEISLAQFNHEINSYWKVKLSFPTYMMKMTTFEYNCVRRRPVHVRSRASNGFKHSCVRNCVRSMKIEQGIDQDLTNIRLNWFFIRILKTTSSIYQAAPIICVKSWIRSPQVYPYFYWFYQRRIPLKEKSTLSWVNISHILYYIHPQFCTTPNKQT